MTVQISLRVGKVLQKIGKPPGLIYCTTNIESGELARLPLTSGYAYTGEDPSGSNGTNCHSAYDREPETSFGARPSSVIIDGTHAIR